MADRRRWLTVAGTLAAVVVLAALGGLAFVYSGAYNVAATEPHTPFGRWVLNTVMERSVAVRADDVPPPPPMDSAMLRSGLEHYAQMCVMCHGAPGVERGEVGKGLRPEPPLLAEAADHLDEREVYWILRHGIKMAGMPAFGPTHSDPELWAITGFVSRLPSISPAEYERMLVAAGLSDTGRAGAAAGGTHEHAPGTAEHSH